MSQLVKVEELDGGIVKVTIDRPDALNALNADVLSALLDAVTPLRAQPDARVVVFTGEGRAFVAGADIRAMSEMSELEAAEFAKLGHDALNAIASLPMPTIAAVNGFALGGGLGGGGALVRGGERAQELGSAHLIGHQPSVINHRLQSLAPSLIGHYSSVVSHQSSVISQSLSE